MTFLLAQSVHFYPLCEVDQTGVGFNRYCVCMCVNLCAWAVSVATWRPSRDCSWSQTRGEEEGGGNFSSNIVKAEVGA